ncbi:MAG TPA: DUF2141 domain-containing protein [Polyangia bacterium]|nr:DUF2141 domain-containing protein [Polyangia bacterium]
MKRMVWFGTIIAAVLASVSVAAARGNSITVRVSTFRSLQGSLRCRLYSRGDGFPGKPPFEAEQSVPVTAKSMTCTFASLAPGTYAVALFHDENDNGKLDTNFVGIPREGVGVSNNKLRSLGPPTWNDAKFALKGDVVLDVSLHY